MQITPRAEDGAGLTVTEAARRAQIVAATIATIAELGYAKTSFAKIKERAGLSSTRIIGYHFTNKAGLMMAVLTAITGAKEEFLRDRAGAPAGRAAMLRAHIETEVAFLGAYPEYVRVLAELAGGVDDPAGWAIAGPVLEGMRTGQVIRVLTQGRREGAFGEFDPEVVGRSVAHAIDGAAAAYAENPALDLGHYGTELADLFDRATRPA
ncbi:TetR/AcrR family transcriptional regulator [Amycolatopsis minnesotensis]|uniref:TetR/AcrR family transcriptional regulator n=1 Tax=Amycolatopsis minnesotensis TaxID=337894 RepID=A0ABN2RZJ3_9PSEU